MSVPQSPAFDFAALAEDIPAPWFILEGDVTIIRWVNQTGQEWLGRSLNTQRSRPLGDFIEDISEIDAAFQRCADSKTVVKLRNIYVKPKSAGDAKCHLTFYPTESGIGLAVQFAGSRSNETRGGGEAVSAMGRMIAHELKNPLAGIKGASQLLVDDINTEEGLSLVKLIGSEIDRISRMIDGIETFGDPDPSRQDNVNIHEILQRARTVIQSAAPPNVTFAEHYDPSLPSILGDEDSLMQAVLNLIKNAVEALGSEGGTIRLETHYRAGARRRVEGDDRTSRLPIEVRIIDDGPGIPDPLREQIFQPFITNKPSGQGLGLSVVSKVASAHSGIVEVRSRPGETIFSILLPLNSETLHEI